MCQKGREPCQAMTEGTKEAQRGGLERLITGKVRFEFWVYYVVVVVVMVILYGVPILPSKDVVPRHIIFQTGIFWVEHLWGGISWADGGMCLGCWGLGKPWEMVFEEFSVFSGHWMG